MIQWTQSIRRDWWMSWYCNPDGINWSKLFGPDRTGTMSAEEAALDDSFCSYCMGGEL